MKYSEVEEAQTYLCEFPLKFRGFTTKPLAKVTVIEKLSGSKVLVGRIERRWKKEPGQGFSAIFNDKDKIDVPHISKWEVSASRLSEVV